MAHTPSQFHMVLQRLKSGGPHVIFLPLTGFFAHIKKQHFFADRQYTNNDTQVKDLPPLGSIIIKQAMCSL